MMINLDYRKALILLWIFLFVFSAAAASEVSARPVEKDQINNEEEIWAMAGFVKPKIEFIDVNEFYKEMQQEFTHSFDLTLVMFRDTGWNKKIIIQRLKKVASIYARCGVRLGKLKFVEAGSPGGVIDFGSPGVGDVEIAQKVPSTFRPVLFYFRAIPKVNAYAWPENTEEDVSDALKNTAWFSLSVTMKLNIAIRHPNYVSEAHELGHILLDSLAHAGAGITNLMAESYDYENDQLTADQCRKIKEHHLVSQIKIF